MCGICGAVTAKHLTADIIKKMNDTMIHRGPDDSGIEIIELQNGQTLGFGQRRLSILDLSPSGHQPMWSADRQVLLTFNGEIYNFNELKKELVEYPFKSNCDTEVIIASYLKWGTKCVDHFNGMFAFALYDKKEESLFLARDRIGKKPLYYYHDGSNIVFGSTLSAIMANPYFERVINKKVLASYLVNQYINAPDSIFENVYKLEPGETLTYKFGKIEKQKYWDIASEYEKGKSHLISSYEEAKKELHSLLVDSVRKRMISDVPLGTFLSGGYDSSLVTAIAQSVSSEKVKTFSIGFNQEKYNEAKYAKEVADFLGTNHTEEYIQEQDILSLVDSISDYYDEPFADSSQVPSMLVARLAKRDVTVVLTGDGGDEFFCGYNSYDYMKIAQRLDILGAITKKTFSVPFLNKVYSHLPSSVGTVADNRNPETKTQFTSRDYPDMANNILKAKGYSTKYEFESRYRAKSFVERRMLLDQDTYISGDILCKVDRATMRYSLEGRCPILDPRVMELSYRIPLKFKYKHGIKKYILKDIAYEYIPKTLLDRPKTGFGVPLADWLHGPLKERLLYFCDSKFLEEQGLFDSVAVNNLVSHYLQSEKESDYWMRFTNIVWSYFVFQQWYEKYMR